MSAGTASFSKDGDCLDNSAMSVPASDRLLTPAEAAELLAVSERWINDAARDGRLPSVKLGRVRRFRRQTLLAFVTELER